MENKTVPLTGRHGSMDKRAEWIAPAIVDYNIEETTRSGGAFPNASDGVLTYS